MRNRFRLIYLDSNITSRNSPNIYLADFSERSNGARGVEVHTTIPQCPINNNREMDCMTVINKSLIEIDFNIFNDHQFKDDKGRDLEHCEGCFYPTTNIDSSWIVFLEIKDCKHSNISTYKDKAISQIVSAVSFFRSKHVITSHIVYGMISIPKSKVSFNNTIFGMPPEYTALRKKHRILFGACNCIEVINDSKIKYKYQ